LLEKSEISHKSNIIHIPTLIRHWIFDNRISFPMVSSYNSSNWERFVFQLYKYIRKNQHRSLKVLNFNGLSSFSSKTFKSLYKEPDSISFEHSHGTFKDINHVTRQFSFTFELRMKSQATILLIIKMFV